jgi:hypothetical protein
MNDASAAFYLHFGFKHFLDAKRTLYLPFGRQRAGDLCTPA